MDKLADSLFGTLKKIKSTIISDDEEGPDPSSEYELANEEKVQFKLYSPLTSPRVSPRHSPHPSPRASPNPSPHSSPRSLPRRHNRRGQHVGVDAEKEDSLEVQVQKVSLTPTYKCSSKGKEDTLLAMSQKTPDGPNSECNRRARSMKGAHSMNSVYRKLHNDKNVHNDRHYLVSVTQQIKNDEEVGSET